MNTDKMCLCKNNVKHNVCLLWHFIENISKEKFNNINKQPAQNNMTSKKSDSHDSF